MFEEGRKIKPRWLKAKIPSGVTYFKLKRELASKGLHTICQSARCPNVCQCWNNFSATFLVMGNVCSRNCLFCSVKKGNPLPLDPGEADRILEMTDIMGSKYIVITSVTRDDLEDGGSRHFADIIQKIKSSRPGLKVEILIPDFKGSTEHLDRILAAAPDVVNHNLETVRGLYPRVNRDPRNYDISLKVLKYSKEKNFITKSGVMVGLGETRAQIEEVFRDIRDKGTDLLTIGQYLQPTRINLAVEKFYTPGEFKKLKETALACGFVDVESGPFVRSSFLAQRMFKKCLQQTERNAGVEVSGGQEKLFTKFVTIMQQDLEYINKNHYT